MSLLTPGVIKQHKPNPTQPIALNLWLCDWKLSQEWTEVFAPLRTRATCILSTRMPIKMETVKTWKRNVLNQINQSNIPALLWTHLMLILSHTLHPKDVCDNTFLPNDVEKTKNSHKCFCNDLLQGKPRSHSILVSQWCIKQHLQYMVTLEMSSSNVRTDKITNFIKPRGVLFNIICCSVTGLPSWYFTMLSILPFERIASASSSTSSPSRDTELPQFKPYSHHPSSGLYPPYGHPASLASMYPGTTSSATHDSGIDLRMQYNNGSSYSLKQDPDQMSAGSMPYYKYNGYPHQYSNMGASGPGSLQHYANPAASSLYGMDGASFNKSNGMDSTSFSKSNGMASPGSAATGMVPTTASAAMGSDRESKPSISLPTTSVTSPTATHTSGSDSTSPSDAATPGPSGSVPSRKRSASRIPDDKKDETYWEKRKKNNDSAKRSRETRRKKEEEIHWRVKYLEMENIQLRAQAEMLKNDNDKLRKIMYANHIPPPQPDETTSLPANLSANLPTNFGLVNPMLETASHRNSGHTNMHWARSRGLHLDHLLTWLETLKTYNGHISLRTLQTSRT